MSGVILLQSQIVNATLTLQKAAKRQESKELAHSTAKRSTRKGGGSQNSRLRAVGTLEEDIATKDAMQGGKQIWRKMTREMWMTKTRDWRKKKTHLYFTSMSKKPQNWLERRCASLEFHRNIPRLTPRFIAMSVIYCKKIENIQKLLKEIDATRCIKTLHRKSRENIAY